jgi:GTP-binding protein
LAGVIDKAGKGLILVVTKFDLVNPASDAISTDSLLSDLAYDFNFTPYAPVILTSSLTGKNITKIFELALDIQKRRTKQIKTSELNQTLRQAVLAHTPAGLKNTLPKLKYIVQTDTSPPWFVIYGSNLKLLHWSYKRYLEKTFRENFDFAGTPIKFSFRDEDTLKKDQRSR